MKDPKPPASPVPDPDPPDITLDEWLGEPEDSGQESPHHFVERRMREMHEGPKPDAPKQDAPKKEDAKA
jgi:hypothetical protein